MFNWLFKRPKDDIVTTLLSGDENRIAEAEKRWASLTPEQKQAVQAAIESLVNDAATPMKMRIAAQNALGFISEMKLVPETPDLVEVPAGPFWMGSSEEEALAAAAQYKLPKEWFLKELPKRRVTLPAFYIMRFLVTNYEFTEFIKTTKSEPPKSWADEQFVRRHPNHPVWGVSWDSACDYAAWISELSARTFRLPSEAEWEKAARGTDGCQYPWGQEWQSGMCNTKEANIGSTTPVGVFWAGQSPYGCLDIAGNIEEWTSDWYRPYEGNPLHIDDAGQEYRVTRGGAWNKRGDTARCARRHGPLFRDVRVGVRLVCQM
jgi:formylglycine-generating enzyme required for sulfatase activity